MTAWFGPESPSRRARPRVRARATEPRSARRGPRAPARGAPELTETDWRRTGTRVRRHAHLIHARGPRTGRATRRRTSCRRSSESTRRRRGRARPPLSRAPLARRRGRHRGLERLCASATSSRRSTRSSRYAASRRAGRELFDVPRAPLPARRRARPGPVPAPLGQRPPRFADRTRVISDEIRRT